VCIDDGIVDAVCITDFISRIPAALVYQGGTDLLGHVTQHDYPYTERHARDLLYQLCAALKFIHHLDIIHRDVRPENCIVSSTLASSELHSSHRGEE